MSRSFSTIPAEYLRSTPQSKDISFLAPPRIPPVGVVVDVDWSAYSASTLKPNVNVAINLESAQPRPNIDRIRSVKIDNTGNDAAVYVFFNDTSDTIACAPNAMVWEPVITNSKIANIVGEGFVTGDVGATRVIFTNVHVPPYYNPELDRSVSLWKGSTTIQRTNTTAPGFSSPALGDQKITYFVPLDGSIQAMPQFHSPNELLYITFIDAILYASVGDNSACSITITNTTTGNVLFIIPWKNVVQAAPNYPLFRFQGNMRLSASDNYTIVGAATGGNAIVTFAYTINPL